MFVLVGDKGKDQVRARDARSRSRVTPASLSPRPAPAGAALQVVILHHMLSKASVRARPSLLGCYKKELGFSRSALAMPDACTLHMHRGDS